MLERFFPGRSRRAADRRYEQDLVERLTELAREAVVLAQEEARHLNHNYTCTEHLLLGLLRDDEGVASRVLASSNVAIDDVREQVEGIVGRDEGETSGPVPFPLTPRSKKILEMAQLESRQLGHGHVGTEHLLLGLLREDNGVAARALSGLGVDREEARLETLHALGLNPKRGDGTGGDPQGP